MDSLFSLEGKTAVVIGGTGELCGEMAMAIAGAGAEVVLVGRNEEKAGARLRKIEDAGGTGYFVATDVTTTTGLEGLLAEVVARSGKCEILVNGAGINSPTPFLEVPEDEYDRIFEVNAKAVFTACQVFGRYVEKSCP
jgi:NAD(P)-dependent dehydrogenase (short-subunit alcohol dehydrogenase family)